MKINFAKVTGAHLDTIFSWLTEPHIVEFWDNTQAHKDDIVNFAEGRKHHRLILVAGMFIGSHILKINLLQC